MPDQLPCCWCGRPFTPRRTGGRDQHCCRPPCRRALHSAAWRWVLAELAAGRLPLAAVKAGLPATCALATDAVRPPPVPQSGPSTLAAPEALARFSVEIARRLVHAGLPILHPSVQSNRATWPKFWARSGISTRHSRSPRREGSRPPTHPLRQKLARSGSHGRCSTSARKRLNWVEMRLTYAGCDADALQEAVIQLREASILALYQFQRCR